MRKTSKRRQCCWTEDDGSPCAGPGTHHPVALPQLATCYRHRDVVEATLYEAANDHWIATWSELRQMRAEIEEGALQEHLQQDGCEVIASANAESALWEQRMEARKNAPTFVYYMVCDAYVKIGRSTAPAARLASIRKMGGVICPPGLDLSSARMARMENGVASLEGERHAQFAHLRAEGEWFRREPELEQFMLSLPVPTDLIPEFAA